MKAKLRLLLLSAGSLTAQNVIDALGARRKRCVVIGTNSTAEAAGNFRCDIAYLVPPAASGNAYIERIDEIIREEHPDLVIPCRDDDVLALATLGERPPSVHTVLLAGSIAAARIMNDKVETARFAARHGLPFAATAENLRQALDLAGNHPLPLIGKPRCGNASHGVVLLRSLEEIKRAFALHPDLIAQPFLDPPPNMDELTAPFEAGLPLFFSFPEPGVYFVHVIIGPDEGISSAFAGISMQVGGQGVQSTRVDNPALLDTGRAYSRAAAAEGWKGPLNVQFKRTPDGEFVAYEMNGRFGGGTAARAHLGFDDIAEVVARFLPDLALPPLSIPVVDVVEKHPRGYPVPRAGLAALQASGKWTSETGDSIAKPAAQGPGRKLRLLLLSVGSRVPQRFIDALGARRERCVLIGTNSVAEAAGNFRCDVVYVAPPAASGPAYVKRLAELIGEERPDLVIPGRDDDVLALAMLGEQSPPTDTVFLTGTVAAARIMNDKVETARFAARHELPFAHTATNKREALDLLRAHKLPLIGKPRSGNGALGVVLLRSTAEIERAFELSPDFIAQPYLDPSDNMNALIAPFEAGMPFFFSFPETALYVVNVIVGPDGPLANLFGCIATQVRGQASQIARCDDVALIEVGRRYAQAAAAEGWKGPLNIQLKCTPENGFVTFELNGRFTGTMAERVHMGSDEIAGLIGQFLPGVTFPSIALSTSDVGQRYLYSYPVLREGVAALRTSGRWSNG